MSARRFLGTTGDVALQLLRLTAASADAFPPLKSAAGGALHIAEIAKKFHSNKEEWRRFGEYVRDATASVVQSLAQANASRGDTRSKLERLNVTLDETAKAIEAELALPKRKRLLKFMKDPEMIVDLRRRVDDEISLFQLSVTMTTTIDVGKIFDAVIATGKILSSIAQDTSMVVTRAASISRKISRQDLKGELGKLQRVQDASWDSSRVCMENTRVKLIDDVMAWINRTTSPNQRGGARVMVLTAVAGGGKTTIAHTISGRCAENKLLGSSFFFDHETAGRNTPAALFTTIAADLSRLGPRLAARIASVIQDDPTLPSAPIFRQFQELVLKPCQECPIAPGPIVVVVDALDEAWNKDLLDILRDHVHKLPSTFRIFITSRMRPELGSLLRQPHVSGIELNIHAQSSLDDIEVYAPHMLRRLAKLRNLGDEWPGEQLRAELITKAGGLFLWVAVVCAYLGDRADPEDELTRLVSKTDSTSSAEDRMNGLYARILESFDWTDPTFVAEYRRVMGIAIATKAPITISAMKELYHGQRLATDYTLQKLSPLLTGLSEADHRKEPVRVMHQSLREFLVIQSGTPGSSQYNIVEKEQSRELALLCLLQLNRDLSQSTPGTGYLGEDKDKVPGVPMIGENAISEALWYACQFWQDHVLDVELLEEIWEALRGFMDEKVILWMEVVAARGRCRGLSEVWGLLEVGTCRSQAFSDPLTDGELQGKKDEETNLVHKYHEEYAGASLSLSNRLQYEDRREEALGMVEEAARLYRELAADRPAVSTPNLAVSLNSLSHCLSDLGRREEALTTVQGAVELCRQLAADRPAAFTSGLAASFNNLSNCLSSVGHHEEALTTIKEAVELYRQLATDRPVAFTSDLALSLNNLSTCLSALGHREEALTTIQEAVKLRRRLAADRPAAFTPDLADSLNNLSTHLPDLGHHEEALMVIQEAVELYRQLAADRPATFTSYLADSLINISNRLFDLGRREEALTTIQEAAELHRQLTADRPAKFTPDLAFSLDNLSTRLYALGHREEALTTIQEAVELRRRLAADRPAAFTPDLADSLNNLSNHLPDLSLREEALMVIQEAVELYRPLAADRPAAFTSRLAGSLNNLSLHLSNLGRREEALVAIQEAITLQRQLATDHPFIFNCSLEQSLNNLVDLLTTMGRYSEALAAQDEADALSN
ncbi:POC1 centriolar protein A [Ceratobasidium sp. 394]|nr:POC1 centriolar protein A [Ceratobasidium sp. 394]